ncbi:choice-of-anchor A family protein [Nonomuraea sp. NBC_00507]|uniref:choice-of-anchor A family protein n=1 Tax=Nonomuraea sp. NBC_00507 TaxID=2976002 RepID=UPI002E192B6D
MVMASGRLRGEAASFVAVHNPGTFIVPGDTRPSALVVNGSIDFGDSSPFGIVRVLNNGYVKIGDLGGAEVSSVDQNGAAALTQITSDAGRDTTPRIELSVSQPEDSVGPVQVIDFDAVLDQFRERSTGLAACPNDVTLLDGNEIPFPDQDAIPSGSTVKIRLTPGAQNVLNINSATLNHISTLTFLNSPSADSPLLINVDTSDVADEFTWVAPNMAAIGFEQARYILWNFPTADSITRSPSGAAVEGTIYAPDADFHDEGTSNIEGNIIVSSLTQNPNGAEYHDASFAGDLTPCTDPADPEDDPTDPNDPTDPDDPADPDDPTDPDDPADPDDATDTPTVAETPDTDDGGRDGDADTDTDAGGAPQGHKHEKHETYEDEHEKQKEKQEQKHAYKLDNHDKHAYKHAKHPHKHRKHPHRHEKPTLHRLA